MTNQTNFIGSNGISNSVLNSLPSKLPNNLFNGLSINIFMNRHFKFNYKEIPQDCICGLGLCYCNGGKY